MNFRKNVLKKLYRRTQSLHKTWLVGMANRIKKSRIHIQLLTIIKRKENSHPPRIISNRLKFRISSKFNQSKLKSKFSKSKTQTYLTKRGNHPPLLQAQKQMKLLQFKVKLIVIPEILLIQKKILILILTLMTMPHIPRV